MTELTVTIQLRIQDEIGNRLLEIKKQRDSLLSRSIVNLRVNAKGLEQARKASSLTRAESDATMKDLSTLGGAVFALCGISVEFQRHRTLAQFWGTSGAMLLGVNAMKNSLTGFLAGGVIGFANWLKNVSASLTQYCTVPAHPSPSWWDLRQQQAYHRSTPKTT